MCCCGEATDRIHGEQNELRKICSTIFHFGRHGPRRYAGNVDALFIFLVVLSGLMSIAIFVMITVFAIRYRKQRNVTAEQVEGSTILEVTWSVVPLGVFLMIFAWGAIIYFQERTPPRDSAEIYVVGKQWMWKLQHVEGQREINELHIPVSRDIKMIMTSQDVIHSFYIPAFRIKQDVLPGRYTYAWFHATKPGTYHLFCAEYCGTMHSGMIGSVMVMEPAQYAAWLSGGGASGSLAQTGKRFSSSWDAGRATALTCRDAVRI